MRVAARRVRHRRGVARPAHCRGAPAGRHVAGPGVLGGGLPGDRRAGGRRRPARRRSRGHPGGVVLAGRTVVVTRPEGEAATLSDLLRARGATVLEAPAIEILPAGDTGPLDEAVADLCEGGFAWVVFSSPRAVDAVCERMDALGYGRGMASMIAAVGPATAAALVESGFHV